MKFACSSDTRAPPRANPLTPASSSSRPAMNAFERIDHLADLAAEGTRVHRQAAAERARNPFAELQPCEAALDGVVDQLLERHGGAGANVCLAAGFHPFAEVESPAEMH